MVSSTAKQSKARPVAPAGARRTARAARASRGESAWRIVGYVDGDSGERAYAVVHRGRRRAWGLRSREAAERWLTRINAPVQAELPHIGRAA